MNYNRFFFFLMLGAFAATTSQAQIAKRDSIIPDQTIEIRQIYKPEIAKPSKPEVTPNLPILDTVRPIFDYVVPQQTLTYTYHSVPIRPLALGKQAAEQPFENYGKVGTGNLSSLYVDFGIGSLKGERHDATIHFSHLSQRKNATKQRASTTEFEGTGTYFTDGHAFQAKLQASNKGYNYYGFDPEFYQYGINAIRQNFAGGKISLAAENLKPNKWNIDYRPELYFGLYGDSYSAVEDNLGFNLPVSYALDSTYRFSLGLNGDITTYRVQNIGQKNNYLQINPAVQILYDYVQMHLQLSPTLGKGNDWYLLPDLSVQTQLFKRNFMLATGWKADLVQNSYQQLSSRNPFLNNDYQVVQTRSDKMYLGFETKLGQHLSFGATTSWNQWKNLALFVNDYDLNPDGKKFAVVYDGKVRSLGLDAFIRYQVADVFSVGGHTAFNSFYESNFARVWHEPEVRMGAFLEMQPLKNLRVGASLDYWDRMFALQATGQSTKLPAFLDLGAQAEYLIIPRLSAFAQLSNILDNKYQRWNQYNNFGFNIIGGLRFKF